MIALFSAFKKLYEKGDHQSVEELIDEVLSEARKEK